MAIDRYRYFYALAFSMFEGHLVAFVDDMVELDNAGEHGQNLPELHK